MSWWKEGVIYQIYPRSFQDSNGDGIGDLRGIIERLDYLNDGTEGSLGVDGIWLCPVYPSPQADFGYDISDYLDIDPAYGSLQDMDDLIEAAHQRGIRVIMDMVLNHTSDQHPWFQDSLHRRNGKDDWYIWHEGKKRPTNWESCFGGTGWRWNEQRNAWYYHSFLPQQPDLNWRNPEVVDAVRQVLEFWLERGIDGFRLDVVNYYFKDARLRRNPVDWFKLARPYDRQRHLYDKDQPELHPLLKQMRAWVDQYPERMMVGEVFIADDDPCSLPASYYGQGDQLHLAFNLEFLRCRFDASQFRAAIKRWNEALGIYNWPCFTLSNHDLKRHISRHKGHGVTIERAQLLATMLICLRGTPFLYYGEEIGMPEQRVPRKRLQDPVGLHYWPLFPGRDGCRRPMMWDSPNTFSTSHQAWLPDTPEPDHTVATQHLNPGSLLNWYRKLIWLRKQHPALARGNMKLLNSPKDVLAWQRSHGNDRILVLLNFSHRPIELKLHKQILVNILADSHQQLTMQEGNLLMQPLQALLVKLTDEQPMLSSV